MTKIEAISLRFPNSIFLNNPNKFEIIYKLMADDNSFKRKHQFKLILSALQELNMFKYIHFLYNGQKYLGQ